MKLRAAYDEKIEDIDLLMEESDIKDKEISELKETVFYSRLKLNSKEQDEDLLLEF